MTTVAMAAARRVPAVHAMASQPSAPAANRAQQRHCPLLHRCPFFHRVVQPWCTRWG
jgi:hypothetical protein